jgi:hypothetical protein
MPSVVQTVQAVAHANQKFTPSRRTAYLPDHLLHFFSLVRTSRLGPNPFPGTRRTARWQRDFEAGTWIIHLKRLRHPLTGSTRWVEFDGTSVTRKVWVAMPGLKSSRPMAPPAKSRASPFAPTTRNPANGVSIGPTAKMALSARPPSANSTMDAANFAFRKTPTAGPFSFVTFGRTSCPTPAHFEQSFSAYLSRFTISARSFPIPLRQARLAASHRLCHD